MLESVNLNDRSFGEVWEDTLSRIPLYSSEWTNFNLSDPGITILKNLTAFNMVQMEAINHVTPEIRLKLLKLIGFIPQKPRPSAVFVKSDTHLSLKKYDKFTSGNLVFEADEDCERAPLHITNVFSEVDGQIQDVTRFLGRSQDKGCYCFGAPAIAQSILTLFFDAFPDFSSGFNLYIRSLSDKRRNTAQNAPSFAKLEWQVFTRDGWEEIGATDNSGAFLYDGTISFLPFEKDCALYTMENVIGYAMRVILKSCEYDVPPCLHSIFANPVTLLQRDTKAFIADADDPDYLQYPHIIPINERQNIRYTEEGIRNRALGEIFGYIGQEIELEFTGNILDLTLLVEDIDGNCELIKPDAAEGFVYTLLSGTNKIRVIQPGYGIGRRMFIAEISVTSGRDGNIREDNKLTGTDGVTLYNLSPGLGGVSAENIETLTKRFSDSLKRPETAVTIKDFEETARAVPGLCIHKVRAFAEKNTVVIVIKPYSTSPFPVLSENYEELIYAHMESYRMLGTKIKLMSPHYVPIGVRGTVYVKNRFKDMHKELEKSLKNAIDCVDSDNEFGKPIMFSDIYAALKSLPGVIAVHDLSLYPQNPADAAYIGMNIIPEKHCLCYLGKAELDITTAAKGDV